MSTAQRLLQEATDVLETIESRDQRIEDEKTALRVNAARLAHLLGVSIDRSSGSSRGLSYTPSSSSSRNAPYTLPLSASQYPSYTPSSSSSRDAPYTLLSSASQYPFTPRPLGRDTSPDPLRQEYRGAPRELGSEVSQGYEAPQESAASESYDTRPITAAENRELDRIIAEPLPGLSRLPYNQTRPDPQIQETYETRISELDTWRSIPEPTLFNMSGYDYDKLKEIWNTLQKTTTAALVSNPTDEFNLKYAKAMSAKDAYDSLLDQFINISFEKGFLFKSLSYVEPVKGEKTNLKVLAGSLLDPTKFIKVEAYRRFNFDSLREKIRAALKKDASVLPAKEIQAFNEAARQYSVEIRQPYVAPVERNAQTKAFFEEKDKAAKTNIRIYNNYKTQAVSINDKISRLIENLNEKTTEFDTLNGLNSTLSSEELSRLRQSNDKVKINKQTFTEKAASIIGKITEQAAIATKARNDVEKATTTSDGSRALEAAKKASTLLENLLQELKILDGSVRDDVSNAGKNLVQLQAEIDKLTAASLPSSSSSSSAASPPSISSSAASPSLPLPLGRPAGSSSSSAVTSGKSSAFMSLLFPPKTTPSSSSSSSATPSSATFSSATTPPPPKLRRAASPLPKLSSSGSAASSPSSATLSSAATSSSSAKSSSATPSPPAKSGLKSDQTTSYSFPKKIAQLSSQYGPTEAAKKLKITLRKKDRKGGSRSTRKYRRGPAAKRETRRKHDHIDSEF